jgi:PAS domain S-box-containing protein
MREMQAASPATQGSENRFEAELDATERLQQVATQLINARGEEALFEQVLDAARAIMRSDTASIQMFHPERGNSGELRLLGHRGFTPEAAKRWEWVTASSQTTCAEALRTRQRVVVSDVRECGFMAGSEDLDGYVGGGIFASQSTPLISRSGAFLGMISTHWRAPHELSVSELRALDILARLASDLIERSRTVKALEEKEKRLASIYDTVRDGIFHLAIEPGGQFRFLSVNAAFLRLTGLSREMVEGKTVEEVIPEPWLTMVLGKYRRVVEEKREAFWEETCFYPAGRLTGEISVAPVLDADGACTHLVGSFHDITDRTRAETAKRESDARLAEQAVELRRITHLMQPVACFVLDLEDRIIYWNPGAAELYGFSEGEATGQICHELLRTQFPAPLAEIQEQVRTTGAWNGELVHTHRDGHHLYVASHWAQHRDAEGRPSEILEVNLDITGRKKAEQGFYALLEAAPDAMVVVDQEGKIVLTNVQVEKLFGYTQEELAGKQVEILMPERSRAYHFEHRRNYFQKPKARQMGVGLELYGQHKDGRRFPVEISLSPLETEEGTLVTSAIRDITGRKEAEAKLRESEDLFRRVFEEGPLGVALVSTDYRFIKVNSALCNMVGYPEAELLEKTFADITHPDDLGADLDLSARLFRGEFPVHRMEKRYVKKTGETIWINLVASIIRDAEGEPLYALSLIEDITEARRRQEEAFTIQKLETVGTLANGIAHDFNNILGAVLAQAEAAMAELPPDSQLNEGLKAISDVAMRGSEIVRQLMMYAGKERETLELVNLSEAAGEMIELLRVSVSKHATLETDLAQDLPPIRGSAAQLRQVIMNLVTNASEAIGNRDGVIRVTTRLAAEENAATPKPLGEEDYVLLEVSDTGCGMTPETRARLFDPFFTTKSGGHGLGLAVVDGIIRRLHGTIDVISEPGKGAAFRIWLPSAKTTAHAPSSSISIAGNRALPQPFKVLVVEDEARLREAVVKVLRKTGFEALEAGDGRTAIELLWSNEGKIDLIFLDATIPGATSDEVAAEAARAGNGVKVILTSAYSPEMVAGALSAPGICGFIRKPFHVNDVVEALVKALGDAGKMSDRAASRN